MEGKRVLITGGNSGIGIVTAMTLAEQGADIVLACRDSQKTQDALLKLNSAGNGTEVHRGVELANLASGRQLASAFREQYDRLDVLINNAGTFPPQRRLTDDGFEMQIGVNHLSHFLLTNLLLDLLKSNAHARIINVSSMLHKKGSIDFDSFRGETKYNSQVAYNQSKLANVLFSAELAARLEGTGVTSNALHPGAVATDIVRDLPWLIRKVIGLIFISPEKGAKTSIMLASDESLKSTTGAYFNQCEREEPSAQATDLTLRKQLWDVSADLVGLS